MQPNHRDPIVLQVSALDRYKGLLQMVHRDSNLQNIPTGGYPEVNFLRIIRCILLS